MKFELQKRMSGKDHDTKKRVQLCFAEAQIELNMKMGKITTEKIVFKYRACQNKVSTALSAYQIIFVVESRNDIKKLSNN